MDIRSKLITPEIRRAGWDDHQIREEFSFKADKTLTDGQMIVTPKTKKARCLDARHIDDLLYQAPNQKIAAVETKGNKYTPCDDLQQAIYYVRLLDTLSAYSSNGDEFVEQEIAHQNKPVDADNIKQSGYLSQYSNENCITKTPIHTFGCKTLYQKPVKNLEK